MGSAFTGFDAMKNDSPNDLEWDKRWNGHKTASSRTIVEFPDLKIVGVTDSNVSNKIARFGDDAPNDAIRNQSYQAKTGAESRYVKERVVINLGVATHLKGEALK